ncbi:MAG: DUF2760 domain-containing protein [Gemmataceae bacterium]|nr:DUF2760 domain-containing protein [Gemmataceae bacterium]
MEIHWPSVGVTVAALVVLKLLILLAAGGGSLARLGLAMRAFFKVMGDQPTADKVKLVLDPPPPEPAKPYRLPSEPIRLLALLQREGRLLDFLLEDISGATDDQIGAAVREIHRKSQKVLGEHVKLERILPGEEEGPVEVPTGFDPSAIQVTGNVTGKPPFKGVLKHHGWRVKGYDLPSPPAGQDDLVVAPAQVEI